MTEAEWLTCEDPGTMLELIRDTASRRKLILFCLYWCPLYWMERANGDPSYDIAMRFAEVGDNVEMVRDCWGDDRDPFYLPFPERPLEWALFVANSDNQRHLSAPPSQEAPDVLRDIIGNPFRPVAADPRWLTSAVVGLADAIYAGRAFDRLPVLADALEEAGCDQPDVLAHCRGPGPHARGCWVVDLILGKS